MATTPTYNWPTPDNTDLVRNGAEAIRDLGDAIDTTVSEIDVATTKGDLLVYDGTDYQRLPVGANDEVLVADSGEATGVKWDEAASGSLTLIASGTLSGTSVSLTGIPSGFDHLLLRVEGPRSNHGSPTQINFRLNNDSATNYRWNQINSSSSTLTATGFSFFPGVTIQNGSGLSPNNLSLEVYHYLRATRTLRMYGSTFDTGVAESLNAFGVHRGSGANTSLQILAAAGSFTNGDYFLYGVN